MIKTWSVEHFKSIYEETELEISPLTIFTGANSSGKSTILQSILLTAQTIQNSISSKSIILNGHIIKLGTFDDILSNHSIIDDTQHISIGFDLNIDTSDDWNRFLFSDSLMVEDIKNSLVSSKFSFYKNEDNEITNLHPDLESSEVHIEFTSSDKEDNKPKYNLSINKSNLSVDQRKKDYKIRDTEIDEQLLKYEVKTNFDVEDTPFFPYTEGKGKEKIKLAGSKMHHFLPLGLGVVYNETYQTAKSLIDLFINSERTYYSRHRRRVALDSLESGSNIEFINIIMEEIKDFNSTLFQSNLSGIQKKVVAGNYEELLNEFTLRKFRKYIMSLTRNQRTDLESRFKQQEANLLSVLTRDKADVYQLDSTSLPDPIEAGVAYVRNFFSKNVKYLGPLRDDPKPVYPHSGATDSMDVGFRGEHTAAVLEIHKGTEVSYLSPEDLEKGGDISPKKNSLIQAVLEWLRYMGIVTNVKTVDKGKLGHELKVSTNNNDNYHDLTNVGVGVSQVLPILVLSLLADKGSTLIFEQPELHLHPRVQTRLADFFVSMIQLNKQCIVESHSEYMVNRLRYRSVVSEDSFISDNVMMYFVEKEDGKSIYNPVKINRYGVIEDWPKGFFDENEENSAAILRAAMQKRRKERGKINE